MMVSKGGHAFQTSPEEIHELPSTSKISLPVVTMKPNFKSIQGPDSVWEMTSEKDQALPSLYHYLTKMDFVLEYQ